MSRTIPIAIAEQDAAPTSTLCYGMKVLRTDGLVAGFVSTDLPLVIDGVTYQPGFDLSALVSSSNLAVDNLDITVLPDGDTTLEADLLAGLWSNAAFTLFRCDYRNPAGGIDELKRGTTGQVTVNRGSFKLEFRSMTQALQQPVGCLTSKTCRARFCDLPRPVPDSLCRLDPADWTVTGEIDAIVDVGSVADTSLTQDDDWFAEGIFTFTSGDNAGLSQKVKAFAGGTFVFSQAFPLLPSIGDAYSVIAGCRHRRREDCHDRFNNVVNFQGEPDLPGVDELTAAPDPNV